MKLIIKDYPYNKDFVFAITIDDLHPESEEDAEHLDFGSSVKKPPLKYIAETIQENPQIKFTLFTVPQWIDRSDMPSGLFFPLRKLWRNRRKYKEETFDITQEKFGKWIKELNGFYPENIEIAPHGLFHHNEDLKYFRSEEFGGLDPKEIEERLIKAEGLFEKAHLKYAKGFRPPGWYMPKEMIAVLKKHHYSYIASNSDMKCPVISQTIAIVSGLKSQSLIFPTNNNGLYNFTANCYPHQIQRAIEIAKSKGILMLHCHIVSTEWGIVAVNKNFPKNISKMSREIYYQTGLQPWFATLDELTKFISAKDQLVYTVTKNGIIFKNKSPFELVGLTFVLESKIYTVPRIPAKGNFVFQVPTVDRTKKVTLVLTTYNGEKTIKDSLMSLRNQTYSNTEILVVNDGSTDGTEKIVREFVKSLADKRIQLITQKNKGRAAAKNTGLKNATGEFIAFCEDDAIYSKDYITSAMSHFYDPQTLGVIGPHFVWNKNDSMTTKIKDLERRRNFLQYKPFSAWIYKKSDLEMIGGFNESLEFGEDVEPGKRLKKLFPKKQFVFEPQSIWFHKEPNGFVYYLIRKWKGGIGMALLDRSSIATLSLKQRLSFTIAPVIVFLVLLGLIASVKISQGSIVWIISFVLLGIWGLIFIRKSDIQKSKEISVENDITIYFYLLLEYWWWGATLLGIYTGYILPKLLLKKLLIGR